MEEVSAGAAEDGHQGRLHLEGDCLHFHPTDVWARPDELVDAVEVVRVLVGVVGRVDGALGVGDPSVAGGVRGAGDGRDRWVLRLVGAEACGQQFVPYSEASPALGHLPGVEDESDGRGARLEQVLIDLAGGVAADPGASLGNA